MLRVLFCLIILFQSGICAEDNGEINGKHLKAFAMPFPTSMTVVRNSSGPFVVTDNKDSLPRVMEWLSKRFNFSFNYTYTSSKNCTPEEKKAAEKLGFNTATLGCFPTKDEADIYVGIFLGTPERVAVMDLSASITEGPFGVLLPVPQPSTNLKSIIQPFSKEVWISSFATILVTIATLHLVKWLTSKFFFVGSSSDREHHSNLFSSYWAVEFSLKVFLSQGDYCPDKRLPIRLIAASWALFCFIILQSYSCTLIAFVSSPNSKPIINSIYDIPDIPGLELTLDKGFGLDLIFSRANDGVYKKLGDQLRTNPTNRCNTTDKCLQQVRDGNHVYVHATMFIEKLISDDWKKNKKCFFTIARDTFMMNSVFLALPKDSPYTETVNRGILELKGNGLLERWLAQNYRKPVECLKNRAKSDEEKVQLTFRNLSPTFLVLIAGWLVSIFAFAAESIYAMGCQRDASRQ